MDGVNNNQLVVVKVDGVNSQLVAVKVAKVDGVNSQETIKADGEIQIINLQATIKVDGVNKITTMDGDSDYYDLKKHITLPIKLYITSKSPIIHFK